MCEADVLLMSSRIAIHQIGHDLYIMVIKRDSSLARSLPYAMEPWHLSIWLGSFIRHVMF